MLRKDREELVAKCSPGSTLLDREELMLSITELANYCNDLELEISKICNKCKKCNLAHNGLGGCNNSVDGKPRITEKPDTEWGGWFG